MVYQSLVQMPVQISIPTQNMNISEYSIIPLHDNGFGYPDITSGDGKYTAHLPLGSAWLSDRPGYYMLSMMVTALEGQARFPLTTVENKGKGKSFIFYF